MEKLEYLDCDYKKYLERIGFEGEAQPDLQTLIKLQEKHVKAIPYENLEIMDRKKITLDIPALYDKIVVRKRGGYCFELNGLFAWLLEEIGFTVIQHFGRWYKGENVENPPMRRHRILRVPIDGVDYICDVGVGMTAPRKPLLFKMDAIQEICEQKYRIITDDTDIYLVQFLQSDNTWENVYSLNDDPCIPIDFYLPHYFCTTYPESPFILSTLVYINTENGSHMIKDTQDPTTSEKIQILICFLQVLFGQSCKTFLDIVACPNWTKLQSFG